MFMHEDMSQLIRRLKTCNWLLRRHSHPSPTSSSSSSAYFHRVDSNMKCFCLTLVFLEIFSNGLLFNFARINEQKQSVSQSAASVHPSIHPSMNENE